MEELYEQITKGVRKPSKNKVGLFLCGTAGSGKTSGRDRFLHDAQVKTSFVYLNVDDIRQHTGSQEKARIIMKQLFHRIIEDGYSFLWDATCRNKSEVIESMHLVKSRGYKIVLGMVYASLKTALERIRKRTNQPLDESIARDIFRHMSQNAETYMSVSDIDEIYLYNNERTFSLIFSRSKKTIKCVSPDTDFYFDVSEYC